MSDWKSSESFKDESIKDIRLYRRLLAVAGSVYLLWWYAVELLLPNSFNPFLGRSLVVATVFGVLILSYLNDRIQRRLRRFFILCVWLITLHYYYLFYGNGGDINWIIGSYITVTAICLGLLSHRALLSYSIFVLVLSLILVVLLPTLRYSVFLPGLITILIQANIGLRSRFGLIKTLADSNERFQLLFNSTFEGILVHQNSRITNVNESLIKMTGFSRADLIGQDALTIIHPEERSSVAEKIKTSTRVPYETRGLRRDGSAIDIELRGKDFRYDSHVARLVNIHDITDRKRAEKEKIHALTMAENVRLRDEFISLASHELKTPISSLKLQTQLIERDLKKQGAEASSPEKTQAFVGIFNRQIDRLIELIDTMLDVSKISVGGLSFDFQTIDFSNLVREVVTTFQVSVAPGQPPTSPITIEANGPLNIHGDRSRLEQVVENLMSNAIKYGRGKPIRVEVSREGPQALLAIEDQGIGIAPEYQERIFNRFERAISPKNISGLGLGLYIAKRIVEGHNGKISVESQLKVGSIFKVSLPVFKNNTHHLGDGY